MLPDSVSAFHDWGWIHKFAPLKTSAFDFASLRAAWAALLFGGKGGSTHYSAFVLPRLRIFHITSCVKELFTGIRMNQFQFQIPFCKIGIIPTLLPLWELGKLALALHSGIGILIIPISCPRLALALWQRSSKKETAKQQKQPIQSFWKCENQLHFESKILLPTEHMLRLFNLNKKKKERRTILRKEICIAFCGVIYVKRFYKMLQFSVFRVSKKYNKCMQ